MMDIVPILLLSAALLVIGVTGLAISRGHLVRLLIALEVIMASVQIPLVAFSRFHGSMEGEVIALFSMGIGVSEAVVGLSLLLVFFRRSGSGDIKDMMNLKG